MKSLYALILILATILARPLFLVSLNVPEWVQNFSVVVEILGQAVVTAYLDIEVIESVASSEVSRFKKMKKVTVALALDLFSISMRDKFGQSIAFWIFANHWWVLLTISIFTTYVLSRVNYSTTFCWLSIIAAFSDAAVSQQRYNLGKHEWVRTFSKCQLHGKILSIVFLIYTFNGVRNNNPRRRTTLADFKKMAFSMGGQIATRFVIAVFIILARARTEQIFWLPNANILIPFIGFTIWDYVWIAFASPNTTIKELDSKINILTGVALLVLVIGTFIFTGQLFMIGIIILVMGDRLFDIRMTKEGIPENLMCLQKRFDSLLVPVLRLLFSTEYSVGTEVYADGLIWMLLYTTIVMCIVSLLCRNPQKDKKN
jgi:hypothetical protein